MIFSILMLLLVGVVAYFHYVQGFFSATLSAALAAVSAALALSLYEPIILSWLGGRYADYAPAILLVVLFAVIYTLLRTLFDKFVPGNVTLPAIVDKIGGAVMGIIAGMFSVGILAIAAQHLPFGPTIGGYARYETTGDRDVVVPGDRGRSADAYVRDELKEDSLDPQFRGGMLLPADDFVVGFVSHLSDNGSLAGARPLESVHPAFLDQVFAARLGIQTGAKKTATNIGSREEVKVAGLFQTDNVRQVDAEVSGIRKLNLQPTLDVPDNQTLLVVRAIFTRDASDKDGIVRFSPGASRLFAGGENYYPIGTLEKGTVLFRNKPDDFLLVQVGNDERGADLVYQVPKAAVFAPGYDKTPAPTVADGVFFEFKRLARIDLSGQKVQQAVPASDAVAVMRKPSILETVPSAAPTIATPLEVQQAALDATLFSGINTQTPDQQKDDVQLTSGSVSLREGKFSRLNIEATETIQRLAAGEYVVRELFAPEGQSILEVQALPSPSAKDPWEFADQIGRFQVRDTQGITYNPRGAVVRLKNAQGQDFMVAQFNADGDVGSVPRAEGRPTDVYLYYAIPSGRTTQSLTYQGKIMQPLSHQIP